MTEMILHLSSHRPTAIGQLNIGVHENIYVGKELVSYIEFIMKINFIKWNYKPHIFCVSKVYNLMYWFTSYME